MQGKRLFLINLLRKKQSISIAGLVVWSLGSGAYSLWASNQNPAPPGGFLETTIFGNLSHRAIEIRLPAKIPVLDKAVRALFSKWPPNFNKCLVFGTISLYFDNFHSV